MGNWGLLGESNSGRSGACWSFRRGENCLLLEHKTGKELGLVAVDVSRGRGEARCIDVALFRWKLIVWLDALKRLAPPSVADCVFLSFPQVCPS